MYTQYKLVLQTV